MMKLIVLMLVSSMFEMNENSTRKHSVNVVLCVPPKRATWATGTMNTYLYRQRVSIIAQRKLPPRIWDVEIDKLVSIY